MPIVPLSDQWVRFRPEHYYTREGPIEGLKEEREREREREMQREMQRRRQREREREMEREREKDPSAVRSDCSIAKLVMTNNRV